MHDEDGFLAVIRQTPADDTARLVFADWLDEQGDGASQLKAAFIRIELRLANDPEAADSTILPLQLQKLATQLDPDWLTTISRPKIEGCTMWAERPCPAVWSRLAPTQDPNARTCSACQKTVRYARSPDEVREYAQRGFCTVVSLALTTRPLGATFRCPLGAISLEREPLIERPRLPHTVGERCPDRQELGECLGNECAEEPPSSGRKAPPARRQKGRHRNIQRENWEEDD
jgi:uncharacterized protein (TIGR02996 family)